MGALGPSNRAAIFVSLRVPDSLIMPSQQSEKSTHVVEVKCIEKI